MCCIIVSRKSSRTHIRPLIISHKYSYSRCNTTCYSSNAINFRTKEVIGTDLIPLCRFILLHHVSRSHVRHPSPCFGYNIGSIQSCLSGSIDLLSQPIHPTFQIRRHPIYHKVIRKRIPQYGHSHIISGNNNKAFPIGIIKNIESRKTPCATSTQIFSIPN